MRNIAGSGKNVTSGDDFEEGGVGENFTPLTREQADKLRQVSPSISAWTVLTGQLTTGVVVALAAALLTGRPAVGWSAFYGALAVVIPGALFARGLTSKVALMSPGAAVAGFFLWEMVKVAVSLGMLFAAPRMVAELDWLALLIGLMVTVQVYWVALLVRPKKRKSD